jgi:hypothetical protein
METPNEKKAPNIDLIKGKITWNENDPIWYKILMTILVAGFLPLMFWLLRGWALSTIAGSYLSGLKLGRGSP